MSETNWCVYMIRTSDNQLYTGITTDIRRRWREHANGKSGARYFRGRMPQVLCFLEEQHTRSSASRREAQIKQLNRKEKDALIATHPAPEAMPL